MSEASYPVRRKDIQAQAIEERGAYYQLGPRHRRFVEYYVGQCSGNALASAREAGFSQKNPGTVGHRLLRHPMVRAAIEELYEAEGMGPNEIIARLANHARGTMHDVLDEEGNVPANLRKLSRKNAALIQDYEVETTKDGTRSKVKLYNSQSALIALAKRYPGLLDDQISVRAQAPDLSRLSDEELMQYMALLKKAGVEQQLQQASLPPGEDVIDVDFEEDESGL